MRILVVSPHPPAFPGSGAGTRLYCLLRELAKVHEVHAVFGTCWGDPVDEAVVAPLCRRHAFIAPTPYMPSGGVWVRRLRRWRRKLFGPPALVWDVLRLRDGLADVLARWDCAPDLVYVHHSITVPLLAEAGLRAPMLVDMHNVMYHFQQRLQALEAPLRERFDTWREERLTLAFERSLLRGPSYFVATSPDDARLMAALAPAVRVRVVPNGVDGRYFAPLDGGEADRLLFLGLLSYGPNDDAVKWFVSDVLPEVRRARPAAHLDVVGRAPSEALRALAADHLDVHADVPDVRPYAARAAVHVVPLRAGSGTRLKILEALAMGRAVVSTPIGAEGLDVVDGEHLLLARSASEFAARTVQLMSDEALRRRLGQNGRRLVEERYDWQVVGRALEAACQEAAGRCVSLP